MKRMLAQIISAVALGFIFFIVMKKYPLKMKTQHMVIVAFVVIVSTILSSLSIMVPLFGFPSVRVGFAQLALVVGGSMLSPSWAFICGVSADIVGVMMAPSGPPFLGFTLNSALACLIPSLWYQYKGKISDKNMMKIVSITLFVLGALAIGYILSLSSVTIKQEVFVLSGLLKLGLTLLIIFMIASMILVLYWMRNHMEQSNAHSFAMWIMCVILIEVSINFALTPIWMQVMYGIPWFMSLFVRILKSCIIIPLNSFVGFSVLKVMVKTAFFEKVKK
ncbi:MAG: folate family ECF transporter S component [Erysipelotrichaceae bacterium]